jgi:hypothetical protein
VAKGKAWTSTELGRLKIMKLDGLPESEIARRLGRTKDAVHSRVMYLSRTDDTFTPARRNHCWSLAEVREMQELYDDGIPAGVIAKRLGTSSAAVYMKLEPRRRK